MGDRVRLSVRQSLSPYPALEPISAGATQSASLAQAERQLKALQEENLRLKREIAETSSAYKQIITESTHENFGERRVNFLKAQLIQLERQVLLYSEALSARAGTLLDVENSLAAIADVCRGYTGSGGSVGQVGISRADLNRVIETAESARIKLYKNIENTSSERLESPVVMFDRFIRDTPNNPPTLMDVCSGRLEHINLKHVAKLESSLSQLYRQLMSVAQSLQSVVSRNDPDKPTDQHKEHFKPANQSGVDSNSANQEVPRIVYVRLGTQVNQACDMLKDVTQELMTLGVLIPSAPWPALRKPFLRDITTQGVMQYLSGLPRSKVNECKQVIESLLKALNYSSLVSAAETKALKEEVQFHQTIYHHQKQYIEELFLALRQSYGEFQEGTNSLICQPLTDILRVYDTLQTTASEDALKYFLRVFKENASRLNEAVHKLSSHLTSEEGQDSISSHGEELFTTLGNLCTEHQQKRDTLLRQLEQSQEQQRKNKDELSNMFPNNNHLSEETNKTAVENLEENPNSAKWTPETTDKLHVYQKGARQESLSDGTRPPWANNLPSDTEQAAPSHEVSSRQHKSRNTSDEIRPPWDNSISCEPETVVTSPGVSSQREKGRTSDTPGELRPPWDSSLPSDTETTVANAKASSRQEKGRSESVAVETRAPWDDSLPCTCGADQNLGVSYADISPPVPKLHTRSTQPVRDIDSSTFQSMPGRQESSDNFPNQVKSTSRKPPKPIKGLAQARLVLKKDGRKQPSNAEADIINQESKEKQLRNNRHHMRKSGSSPNMAGVFDPTLLSNDRPTSGHQDDFRNGVPQGPSFTRERRMSSSSSQQQPVISPVDYAEDPAFSRQRSGSLSRQHGQDQKPPKIGQLEPLLSTMGESSYSNRNAQSMNKPSWK